MHGHDKNEWKTLYGLDQEELNKPSQSADFNEGLFLWHANSKALFMPDVIMRRKKKGVQLNPLSRALRCYQGRIFLRKLRVTNPAVPRNQLCTDRFHDFMEKMAPRDYTNDPNELLKAIRFSHEPDEGDVDDDDSFFCSKLVARSLKELGYLNCKAECSEYDPDSFSDDKMDMLSDGVFLQPTVRLIMDGMYS